MDGTNARSGLLFVRDASALMYARKDCAVKPGLAITSGTVLSGDDDWDGDEGDDGVLAEFVELEFVKSMCRRRVDRVVL